MKRMKIMLLSGCFLTIQGRGQTFSEWFRQKKTQLKYLHQQIAAIQAYIIETEEGYELVQEGCLEISLQQVQDTILHSDHFLSLLKVKPAISHLEKVASIRVIGKKTVDLATQLKILAGTQSDWGDAISSASETLASHANRGLSLLAEVTTDGEISMKDEKRVACLDQLYETMLALYAAGLRFYLECTLLKKTP